MDILVIGGTRFYGIPMIRDLVEKKYNVTIGTRGNAVNPFEDRTSHVRVDRKDERSIREALGGRHFDVIIDKVAYVPTDVRKLLNHVTCGRYILASSCAVYQNDHEGIEEAEFVPEGEPEWTDWADSYAEAKRLTERAAAFMLGMDKCVFVRYPVVLGKSDHTERLRFYVEHVMKELPMRIDNPDHEISYINEDEAGKFISHLVGTDFTGAVNGCSEGSISAGRIIEKLQPMTGKRAILSGDGDDAPFNGTEGNRTFSVRKAADAGFRFSGIDTWIDGLLQYYIDEISK